jgi:ATP-dependent exoDNAse (exonuclease V) alpha subunit
MRLAGWDWYASTVHKSQGLSLDAVQINLTNAFFGSPAMAYVALSRCRTAEGLRIIGDKATLARRIKTDPKVLRFL